MQDFYLFLQHHRLLSAAFLLVLFLLVIIEFIRSKRAVWRISPMQTVQMINHQNAAVIDIRSLENFKNGHIVGSISLPLQELEKNPQKLDKYKTQPIVLVCAAGIESQRAVMMLTKTGFINIYQLAGGIRAWREADMPLVKD